MEETDCGTFFDDLLDFPVDDMDAALPPVNNQEPFPSIWSHQPETFPCPDSVFSNTTSSDLSAELSVPYEDIVQLEWLSTFVEDSFSGEGLTISKKSELPEKESRQPLFIDTQISIVDSSSSSSSSCSGDIKATQGGGGGGGGISPAITLARYARARSKRARPTSFNPRSSFSLGDQTSPRDDSNSSSNNLVSKSSSSSKKKKKIRFTGPVEVSNKRDEQQQEMSCSEKRVRKCQHCEITKTPQWRAGPLGPKTLCNACGVRYKSGRLFPEYRPAASPTFVPCLHSNSHKKVIEMRSNNCTDLIPNTALPLHH